MRKLWLLAFFLMLPGIAGLNIINSNDWKFVLLVMEYSHYQGDDVIFLLTESQSEIIAANLVGEGITVYEDLRNPVVKDYSAFLKAIHSIDASRKDFRDYKEFQEFMFKALTPETLFVASTLEPENTLVSIPLAYKKKGLVLFPTSSLFSRLTDFNEIYLVGGIERDFRRELLSVAALIEKPVNIVDQGSPYKNSLVLLDEWGTSEVLYISTGGFLEPTLLNGDYPLVLTGRDTYSDDFLKILKNMEVNRIFVIGAELMNVARRIRDGSNQEIAVIVKYGETYTSAGYSGTIYALSVYQIPIPQPNVTLSNVLYDPEDGRLYVKYGNYGDGLAYVSSITRIAKDGETLTSLSDDEVFLLWPGDEVVRVFTIDLTEYGLNNLDVNIDARFGRYPDFLVNVLDITAPITVTRVLDSSSIDLERATYDGSWLRVYVRNIGAVDAFVSGQAELFLDGATENFQLTGLRLNSGKTGVLKLRIRLDEEDIDNNQFVNILIKHGERQDLLIKTIRQRAQLEIIEIRLELLIGPSLALLFLIALVAVVNRMRKRRYYRASRRIRKLKTRMLTPTTKRRRKRRVRRSY
ncbi:MAG: hypothetical protein GOU98_03510 [Candidatus Altiarchaeota archaeon]|nr:hypothetical protein [Candidatus Altiarchaeota archaeon]